MAKAAELARGSLRLWENVSNRLAIAQCLEVLAWTAVAEVAHERSAVLLGAAEAVWQGSGAALFPD